MVRQARMGNPKITSEEKLLSIRGASEYLGKSRETVTKALRQGQLPHRKFAGRTLIPVSALQHWLAGTDDTGV